MNFFSLPLSVALDSIIHRQQNKGRALQSPPFSFLHLQRTGRRAAQAILEMNLLGHEFFLFRSADTDEVQAVYRRHNGTYGLLVPER